MIYRRHSGGAQNVSRTRRARPRGGYGVHRRPPGPPEFEPLEPRTFLSATVLEARTGAFTFQDADGDAVTIHLKGPGAASVTVADDAAGIESILLTGTTTRTRLRITVAHSTQGDGAVDLGAIVCDGRLGVLRLNGAAFRDGTISVQALGRIIIEGDLLNTSIVAAGRLGTVRITGDVVDDSLIAAADHIRQVRIGADVVDTMVLAGVTFDDTHDLTAASFAPAVIGRIVIGGDVVDSIVAAGADPGADGLFENGEVLDGGRIRRLKIGGLVIGAHSPHINPGIYAARLDHVNIAGFRIDSPKLAAAVAIGTAVIDPLPSAAHALTVADIKSMLERAIARAQRLGVNATISVVDREGNILAIVRMAGGGPPPALSVDIEAGGRGGLEAVDGIVPTSIIAATKAGTAAFLSSSQGNAFTTRTAGQIIQRHFPVGVRGRPGGPLFGVQLSNLPTSDVNRLPLGLSADPGGLPLYRSGELIGGLGVEVNRVYTVDRSGAGGGATIEEKIALAGQIGLQPPPRIRADRIFVEGVRLEYANAAPPKLRKLGPLPDYDTLVADGDLVELVAPRLTPTGPTGRDSKFAMTLLPKPGGGFILGEVPDGSRAPGGAGLDFFDEGTGTLAFLDGDPNGGEQLTAAEVESILGRAHALNVRLRAAIRKDRPQISQVTVAVVDHNGNILGVFRSPDAPVFGFDVAVQKARTAAFMSRPDAGDELRALDMEVDIAAIKALVPGIIDASVTDPYGRHVDRGAALGIDLDGSVAMSDRAGGFLARPNLPDGINGAPPGPFSALPPDRFSPFNTGLQTILAIPELVEFLLDFLAVGDEAMALDMFTTGALGGGGVVPLDANSGDSPSDLNPGGGLPASSLANGLQIFAGSVPLYKNGVLVGGIGVSGDGIDQDDYVAFAGSGATLPAGHPGFFQDFGPDVRRSDRIVLPGGFRLPYVKLPRSPFAGV